MPRRPALRKHDVEVLLACGLKPKAMDLLASGGVRVHFEDPAEAPEDDLDRELKEFEARRGQG